jgi:disease resistance protein RPM1
VLPPLSFLEGAMPMFQRIELRFRMAEGVYGLENLSSIRQVVLTVSSQAPKDAKGKAHQVKELASMIHGKSNALSVVLDEYNESTEQK